MHTPTADSKQPPQDAQQLRQSVCQPRRKRGILPLQAAGRLFLTHQDRQALWAQGTAVQAQGEPQSTVEWPRSRSCWLSRKGYLR